MWLFYKLFMSTWVIVPLLRPGELNRAHVLLLADEGRNGKDIAEALHTNLTTAELTRRCFVAVRLVRPLNELRCILGQVQPYRQEGDVLGGAGLL